MTQWFRGQLEGHYVGTGQGGPAVSQYGSADRYKLRIYRALVRDIETLDSKGAPPRATKSDDSEEKGDANAGEASVVPPAEIPDECFYQAKIEDTRLIGIRPRTCFEGTIYDVAVANLRVTHSTKKGAQTYGRVVGEVYGRFLLPPEADPEAAAQVAEELTAKTSPHKPGSEEAIAALGAEAASEIDDDEDLDELHPPTAPMEGSAAAQVPVPLLAIVMGVLLWLGAGILPALVWTGLFIPILIVRFILGDQFRVTSGQRIFGAVLVAAQFACLAIILLDWWTDSCIALNPFAAAGVGLAALIASVLPSSFPILCTGAGLAGILFLGSGSVAATCESLEPTPRTEEVIERPSVTGPGVPRTNDDGSWPRRRTPAVPPVSPAP